MFDGLANPPVTPRRVLHLVGRGATDRTAFGPGHRVTRVVVTSVGSAARVAREHLRRGEYDGIVASGRLGVMAIVAGGAMSRPPFPAVASVGPEDGRVGGLLRVAARAWGRAGFTVVVPSGATGSRLGLTARVIVPPTPRPNGHPRQAARALVRSAAGLGADDAVVLAPGDSTREAGHGRAVWGVALLFELDRRSRLLLAGTGAGSSDVAGLAAKLVRRGVVRRAGSAGPAGEPFDPWSLACSADAAVFVPTGPVDPAPLLACLAAGVPVVASRSGVAAEWVDDSTAWLVDEVTPRALARRLLDVREAEADDPHAFAAKVEAGRAFASRFTTEATARAWASVLAGPADGSE